MRVRRLVPIALLAAFVLGLTVNWRLDDTASVAIETAGADGAPGNGVVFYSGLGEAGVGAADPYSDWEFVDDGDLFGRSYSDWSEGACSPDGAASFPSDRGLDTLVGYSLGRLGPMFVLRHRSRWEEIDTIWLLDPGTASEMDGSCEGEQRDLRRPSADLAEWLAASGHRRLFIISAASTNADDRRGLEDYYLADIRGASPEVAGRTFVCVDRRTAHDDVVGEYMPLVAHAADCPGPSERQRIEGTPRPTSPPETSPPPTSPPQTTPPPTPPPQTSPPPTSPPQTAPPSTSPPQTSPPPTTSPSRAITVYNKVTNGGTMREDTPAYLSTVTRNFCKRDGCALSGTDMGTGAQIVATCQTRGDRTTNGQDGSTVDDGNPELYESTLWYGVRWGDGRFGFISEVWIRAADRGGLGLPGC